VIKKQKKFEREHREEIIRMMTKIAFNYYGITWPQIEQDGKREVPLMTLSSQILSFNKNEFSVIHECVPTVRD
jgi:hypothetical protein